MFDPKRIDRIDAYTASDDHKWMAYVYENASGWWNDGYHDRSTCFNGDCDICLSTHLFLKVLPRDGCVYTICPDCHEDVMEFDDHLPESWIYPYHSALSIVEIGFEICFGGFWDMQARLGWELDI